MKYEVSEKESERACLIIGDIHKHRMTVTCILYVTSLPHAAHKFDWNWTWVNFWTILSTELYIFCWSPQIKAIYNHWSSSFVKLKYFEANLSVVYRRLRFYWGSKKENIKNVQCFNWPNHILNFQDTCSWTFFYLVYYRPCVFQHLYIQSVGNECIKLCWIVAYCLWDTIYYTLQTMITQRWQIGFSCDQTLLIV